MAFRPEVLFVFVTLEVLLFGTDAVLQALVSILEYAFVALALLRNRKIGLMYFLSFSLLSMGAWTYVLPGAAPANFWGLRLSAFSVNTWFTLFVFGVPSAVFLAFLGEQGVYGFWHGLTLSGCLTIYSHSVVLFFTVWGEPLNDGAAVLEVYKLDTRETAASDNEEEEKDDGNMSDNMDDEDISFLI